MLPASRIIRTGLPGHSCFCHHLDLVLQRLFDEKPTILLQNELLTRQQQMNENPVDVFKKTGVFVVIITP